MEPFAATLLAAVGSSSEQALEAHPCVILRSVADGASSVSVAAHTLTREQRSELTGRERRAPMARAERWRQDRRRLTAKESKVKLMTAADFVKFVGAPLVVSLISIVGAKGHRLPNFMERRLREIERWANLAESLPQGRSKKMSALRRDELVIAASIAHEQRREQDGRRITFLHGVLSIILSSLALLGAALIAVYAPGLWRGEALFLALFGIFLLWMGIDLMAANERARRESEALTIIRSVQARQERLDRT